jgi:Acetyltransferase (GNAT) domain
VEPTAIRDIGPSAKPAPRRAAPVRAEGSRALLPSPRHLSEADIPGVAALFTRVYQEQRWGTQAACEAYIAQMLFDNPWRDPDLPSWVAEEKGVIVGFQAILPRPMKLNGRPIRAAVSCQFMVAPDRRHSLTALQLMKKCLSGPQDLIFADGANDQAVRFWTGLGGHAALLYGLHWTRPLRPARYALSLVEKRSPAHPLTRAARPLAAMVDLFAARMDVKRLQAESKGLRDRPLDTATMLAHLPEVMRGNVLQPVYDERSLSWLLEQTAQKMRHGSLRSRSVLDGDRLLGWYLYYARHGAAAEVVQLAARYGSYERVLERMMADAVQQGATAIRGRLDPQFAQQLSDWNCWFRREGTWTLFHSRDPEIAAAMHQGSTFLTRLEGEWWMRFHGV